MTKYPCNDDGTSQMPLDGCLNKRRAGTIAAIRVHSPCQTSATTLTNQAERLWHSILPNHTPPHHSMTACLRWALIESKTRSSPLVPSWPLLWSPLPRAATNLPPPILSPTYTLSSSCWRIACSVALYTFKRPQSTPPLHPPILYKVVLKVKDR